MKLYRSIFVSLIALTAFGHAESRFSSKGHEANLVGGPRSGRCSLAERCCLGRDSSCMGEGRDSNQDLPCYCDEGCLETGDCCTDYQEICNVKIVNCEVSEWSEWSPCDVTCGKGVENRSRVTVQHPSPGGQSCPVLQQKRSCLGTRCSTKNKKYKSPIRETAGLLPAKFYLSLHAGAPKWDVRENLFNRKRHLERMRTSYLEGYQADQPDYSLSSNEQYFDSDEPKQYCIVFELEKVTKACKADRDFNKMETGLRFCALCPSDAQRDSLGGRCRGHGVDYQLTRWRSTVHPKCHGKWRRVYELADCPCSQGPDFVFV